MPEIDRGTDRASQCSKRFLSPSQKYEIWLQLVRQEVTIAEAAAAQHVDLSTTMRIPRGGEGGCAGGAGRLQAGRACPGTRLRAGAGQDRGGAAV
jgi:transposase